MIGVQKLPINLPVAPLLFAGTAHLAEVKAIEASYNLRLSSLEAKSQEAERKADNLTYRVTVTEQTPVSISTAIKELQADFNRQSSDIQVMKEILQRLEAGINRRAPTGS